MPRGTGQHSIYGGGSHVSHSKLQSPLTIQWLNENYEVAEGVSLPRSALYSHYLDFCEKNNLAPVNAASFGKIIRHTFPNLKTRRLGTRGQSKYHYYGITIQATSPYHDTVGHTARQSSTGFSQSYSKTEVEERTQTTCSHKTSQGGTGSSTMVVLGGTLLPDFPQSDQLEFSDNVPLDKAKTFLIMYRAHCQRILDTILRANFGEVQNFLIHFWQGMPNHMLEVLECGEVVELVGVCDSILYKAISGVLIPGPLQPLPASLTQAIRQFAVELSEWLTDSLSHLPAPLQEKKLAAAKSFSRSLRRQTSLTHLAQAARTVLHSAEPVAQMLADWKQIDFECVARQALWITSSDVKKDYENTQKYYEEFCHLLEQQSTIDQYAEWASSLVERCVKQQVKEGKTLKECAREFLQKWTFFSARITRELTLCSASSFGSFHLLHMLLEDYIMYILENQNNAEEKGSTVYRRTVPNPDITVKTVIPMELDKPRAPSQRKTNARRSSSTSSTGSLRSPREPVRRYPAQSPRLATPFGDVSPHLMASPSTPTNNNNNISKHPVSADQGHFIYPTPEMSPRYNTPAPNHVSPFGMFSAGQPYNANSMGDFDMNRSYVTDRYPNQDGAGDFMRAKPSMAEPGYGMMNNNSLAYDYRNVPPTLVDHMKHYSQYPVAERTYPSPYMYSSSPMPPNSLYPLQGVSGGAPEKYYPDVLEEFVDMQAAVQHGQPGRPMRSEFTYPSAILST